MASPPASHQTHRGKLASREGGGAAIPRRRVEGREIRVAGATTLASVPIGVSASLSMAYGRQTGNGLRLMEQSFQNYTKCA